MPRGFRDHFLPVRAFGIYYILQRVVAHRGGVEGRQSPVEIGGRLLMIMDAANLQYMLAMAATVAFAVTAVLAVTPRGIDLFGACVMGLITAIGGGTMRDLILGAPVFWATDLNYVWVALGASLVAFQAHRLMTHKQIFRLMLYVDALGVSMFAIQAAHKVLKLDFGLPVAPVLLGVITAIGGGLLRDVLAGNPTLLMRREIYAIPVTLGCTLYVVLLALWPEQAVPIGVACVMLTLGLRAAAIHWDWRVPIWMTTHSKDV